MKLSKVIIIPSLLILSAIITNVLLSFYMIPNRYIGIDQTQHFYDMKKWYDSGKLPTAGARFISSEVVNDEYTTPRVPGGAYYIFYTLFYKLSGESFLGAKIINYIFNLIIIFIFLFWFYKRFGFFVLGFITPLILCNGYFVIAVTDFWNPNLALIFSFLLFIFLFEYIDTTEEEGNRKNIVKLSAVLIFPVLAVMAQGHFFTFYSMIPSVIVYLILKYKRTLKYVIYWILGVFISFLEYLPYLISEFNNNFLNLNMALNLSSKFGRFSFPQIYALLLFPTNEISNFFGTTIHSIIFFWENNSFRILGILFLLITVLFSIYCFLRSLLIYKKYMVKNNTEYIIIEMFKLYLIFIFVTIFFSLILKSKTALFHYQYSIYSISFIPIILLFTQWKSKLENNNKMLYVFFLFIFLNIIAVSTELYSYTKIFHVPRNIKNMELVINDIYKYSNGNEINLIESAVDNNIYRDIAVTFFPEKIWKQNDNSTNIYFLLDKLSMVSKPKAYISNYINYINNNSILLNNYMNKNVLYLYKYNGTEPLRKP
ncbi:hypothetical protein [Brachyspira hampsonii]|uniref:hypothetical protein n=1 Tax=Brachyspira hampsonii TaxID=1287055 RepID=UPI000D3A1720|nr:hypothetical protein [Brachyspira hampsonii]PTY40929.1 hypothetical protein DQ06_10410 [Brachyspira hampsonii bv. II]